MLVVLHERVRSDFQQQLDDPLEVVHRSEVQRRVAVQILVVDRDAELDQDTRRLVEMLLVAHPMRVVRIQDTAV